MISVSPEKKFLLGGVNFTVAYHLNPGTSNHFRKFATYLLEFAMEFLEFAWFWFPQTWRWDFTVNLPPL